MVCANAKQVDQSSLRDENNCDNRTQCLGSATVCLKSQHATYLQVHEVDDHLKDDFGSFFRCDVFEMECVGDLASCKGLQRHTHNTRRDRRSANTHKTHKIVHRVWGHARRIHICHNLSHSILDSSTMKQNFRAQTTAMHTPRRTHNSQTHTHKAHRGLLGLRRRRCATKLCREKVGRRCKRFLVPFSLGLTMCSHFLGFRELLLSNSV